MRLRPIPHPRAITGSGVDDVLALGDAAPRRGSLRQFLRSHPWLTDISIALLYVAATFSSDTLRLGGLALAITVIYVVIMAVAVALRRCQPLGFLAAAVLVPILYQLALTAAPGAGTTTAARTVLHLQVSGQTLSQPYTPYIDLAALCLAVFTVGSECALRISLPATATTLLATTGVAYIWGTREVFGLLVLVVWLLLLIAYLIGSNIRSSRLRMAELENRARQLTLEHEQREQLAVSQERNRIAREMHDVVSHSLSVMVTLAEGAAVALERNPDMAKTAVTQLAQVGRDSLQDARRLVGVLRQDAASAPTLPGQPAADAEDDVPREPQPGEHDVRRLVASYKRAGMPVTLEESGPELPPDPGLHLAIYRIVQESLTNVLRYARTSKRISVTLSRSGRDIVITIENDAGDGRQVMPGSGKGVIGMRERAAVYDGTVHAGPTTKGWQVRATLRVPGQPHTWSSPI